jgi:hypothetical protein
MLKIFSLVLLIFSASAQNDDTIKHAVHNLEEALEELTNVDKRGEIRQVQPTSTACPTGFNYVNYTGKCYYAEEVEETWYGAVGHCEHLTRGRGRLAEPRTKQELIRLINDVPLEKHWYWIGVTNLIDIYGKRYLSDGALVPKEEDMERSMAGWTAYQLQQMRCGYMPGKLVTSPEGNVNRMNVWFCRNEDAARTEVVAIQGFVCEMPAGEVF